MVCLGVAVHDIPCLKVAFLVDRILRGVRTVEVARDDGWASDAHFPSHIEGSDIFPVVVSQPNDGLVKNSKLTSGRLT